MATHPCTSLKMESERRTVMWTTRSECSSSRLTSTKLWKVGGSDFFRQLTLHRIAQLTLPKHTTYAKYLKCVWRRSKTIIEHYDTCAELWWKCVWKNKWQAKIRTESCSHCMERETLQQCEKCICDKHQTELWCWRSLRAFLCSSKYWWSWPSWIHGLVFAWQLRVGLWIFRQIRTFRCRLQRSVETKNS